MQIREAIETARQGADHMDEKARGHEWMFEFRIGNAYRMQATAIRTVCDKLEALLTRQEEDNSYHSR